MKNNQQILIGDCRQKLKEIKKETVSLAVTSPPYNINKKYGKYNDNVSLDEWKELIKEVFLLTHKCLKKDGSFFLNISPVPKKKNKRNYST